jgi:hypothetical protein
LCSSFFQCTAKFIVRITWLSFGTKYSMKYLWFLIQISEGKLY